MKGVALFLLVVAAVAIMILPTFLLNPFAPETERGLTAACTAKRYAPLVTFLFAAAGVWLATKLWDRWWRKTLVVFALLLLAAAAWLSHQNHFEWMFKPLSSSAYASVNDAGFVAEPRTIVIGVRTGGTSKAYPLGALEKQSPIIDTIGTTPVLVVLGSDRKSVRAFNRAVDGKTLELFAKPGTTELIDTQTGSEWDFTGRAIRGPLTGKTLQKLEVLRDYWFDWRTYNPRTAVYTLGER
jgi:hypothetical protein